jgi:hypothetical protein
MIERLLTTGHRRHEGEAKQSEGNRRKSSCGAKEIHGEALKVG